MSRLVLIVERPRLSHVCRHSLARSSARALSLPPSLSLSKTHLRVVLRVEDHVFPLYQRLDPEEERERDGDGEREGDRERKREREREEGGEAHLEYIKAHV